MLQLKSPGNRKTDPFNLPGIPLFFHKLVLLPCRHSSSHLILRFMKKIMIIVLALASNFVYAQKWSPEFGLSYAHSKPVGGMGQTIARGNGASTYFGLATPNKRFAFGMDLTLAEY